LFYQGLLDMHMQCWWYPLIHPSIHSQKYCTSSGKWTIFYHSRCGFPAEVQNLRADLEMQKMDLSGLNLHVYVMSMAPVDPSYSTHPMTPVQVSTQSPAIQDAGFSLSIGTPNIRSLYRSDSVNSTALL
jgi:hypothetical protein